MDISLDTETTGVDLRHGAKPFLVTSCDEDQDVTYWEWDVDPLTRGPIVPERDKREIQELIDSATRIVLQNPKFDVAALKTIMPNLLWDWNKVDDTLFASHILASDKPHDLTTSALYYLGVNIKPLEDAVKKVCSEARTYARRVYPDWRIAKKGLPEMPSAKESVWKFDMWLPKAIAKAEGYEEDHPYWTACANYANGDSAVTLPLRDVMLEELEARDLLEIYYARLPLLRIVYEMEEYGVTLNGDRLNELVKEYRKESEKCARVCTNIAKGYGYDLTLPKGGNNKSLTTFVFDEMKLPAIKRSPKTGAPSLDAKVLETYHAKLPPRSKQLTFIRNLSAKRKRDTAVTYMEGYKRFWRRVRRSWYRLHPSLNPTGTGTLRWSSSNPNEQNISKKEGFNLRYCFGPAPGREWWSLDAKNIELRIPAYESGERELIELFEHPDDPPYYGSTHLLNFHTVYTDIWDKELKNVSEDEVGPYIKKKYASTWYQWCKNGGFAVQYGAVEREEGTADIAFHRPGSHAKLKARFSKLEALNRNWIGFAEKHGHVETMPDKTVNPERGYPLNCPRGDYGRVKPTVPLNYHVQSTAMWVMARGMIIAQEYLDELNSKSDKGYYLIMQIHDEIVLDFPYRPKRGNLPKVMDIKRRLDSIGDDLVPEVPITFGIEYHPDNWSEGVVAA